MLPFGKGGGGERPRGSAAAATSGLVEQHVLVVLVEVLLLCSREGGAALGKALPPGPRAEPPGAAEPRNGGADEAQEVEIHQRRARRGWGKATCRRASWASRRRPR